MSQSIKHYGRLTLCLGFHAAAIYLAIVTLTPVTLKPHPRLAAELLSGRDGGYRLPGSQFKVLKPLLPKQGRFSLIYDRPCPTDTESKEFCYDAQNYLAPLLINVESVEPAALVMCASQELADKRLLESGYEWTYQVRQGQGLARKIA